MSPFKRRNLLLHIGIVAAVTLFASGSFTFPSLWVWLCSVNIWLFLVFGSDKLRAHKALRRTPETTFLTLAVLGGFPALFLGRKIFKHKTVKQEFIAPMWGLFILELGAIAYFYWA